MSDHTVGAAAQAVFQVLYRDRLYILLGVGLIMLLAAVERGFQRIASAIEKGPILDSTPTEIENHLSEMKADLSSMASDVSEIRGLLERQEIDRDLRTNAA